MATRDTAPVGAPCWTDLLSSDTDRSIAFYSQLFGWTADPPAQEFGGYINFRKNGVLIAGLMGRQPGWEMPDAWSVYLTTDDARKTVDVARANGGQVQSEPMDVGPLGTMAILGDPGGATIGLWQPGEHRGFGLVAEDGAPSWFELQTRDYNAAVDFYREVFRWNAATMSDTPEFRYTTLKIGEDMYAGIMDSSQFHPAGLPAYWSVYFGADDVDATISKLVELGGQVRRPAEDTPYGRLAVAVDPTGAEFKLVGPNEAMPARA
jgi:predicted enzyme related to lactoylglutathione lyase